MRITAKGQVTIPVEIREKLGLMPNCEVEFVLDGDSVRLQLSSDGDRSRRGRSVIERMRGRANSGLSTDQIMALTRSARR